MFQLFLVFLRRKHIFLIDKYKQILTSLIIFLSIFQNLNASEINSYSSKIEFKNVCMIDYSIDSLYCTLFFKKLNEFFMFSIDFSRKENIEVRFFELKNDIIKLSPNPLPISSRKNQKYEFKINKIDNQLVEKLGKKSDFELKVKSDNVEFIISVVDKYALKTSTAKLKIIGDSKLAISEEVTQVDTLPAKFISK